MNITSYKAKLDRGKIIMRILSDCKCFLNITDISEAYYQLDTTLSHTTLRKEIDKLEKSGKIIANRARNKHNSKQTINFWAIKP